MEFDFKFVQDFKRSANYFTFVDGTPYMLDYVDDDDEALEWRVFKLMRGQMYQIAAIEGFERRISQKIFTRLFSIVIIDSFHSAESF